MKTILLTRTHDASPAAQSVKAREEKIFTAIEALFAEAKERGCHDLLMRFYPLAKQVTITITRPA